MNHITVSQGQFKSVKISLADIFQLSNQKCQKLRTDVNPEVLNFASVTYDSRFKTRYITKVKSVPRYTSISIKKHCPKINSYLKSKFLLMPVH